MLRTPRATNGQPTDAKITAITMKIVAGASTVMLATLRRRTHLGFGITSCSFPAAIRLPVHVR